MPANTPANLPGNLPAGLTVRPIRPDDIEAIHAQMAAYTTRLLGYPKHSLDNVADYLRNPALSLATDSWLVFDGTEIVGTSSALLHIGTDRISLDVFAADRVVAGWLLDNGTAHCSTMSTGLDEVTVKVGVLREDEAMVALLSERGMTLETSHQRMRIDHEPTLEAPPAPAGVAVRRGTFDDATRRAAHQVIATTFADQPGAVPPPYDDWLASREARSTFDWSLMTLLEIDGRAVAARECSDNFVASEDCGYIGRLAVLAEARGRGLAKYLLRDQFALDAAAGRSGTMLHVDNSNPTPAVGLYLGVGMRPTVTSDIWTQVIPAR
ncbi:ribosomal protein S18 acetylase RimI-like enzyme [Kribbella sp. VKM Ac-2527]|uniref:Ribosomal protein S18 acetylase RimI-like enzyme n=1 Tax=Kribbella caucasensis TaxID=2512215 RepID=A0A4R6KKB9_9ACTN|nr:GNAT family N-acetyltransferase [Kribbella sp. VKM Ac-2527]TDO50016.1 ribosomal protein S18 acetylase RimI-like enzyme [Kribbella sp. VKM Ac-2527]